MKAKFEYQPFFGELLVIAEAAITLPVSNAWPERGASGLKIVKNQCRSPLQNDMLEAMHHVKNNGPALGSPKMVSLATSHLYCQTVMIMAVHLNLTLISRKLGYDLKTIIAFYNMIS